MKLITPKSHEHWLQLKAEDISSTEVSALFGLNPYTTEFELWHRKKNKEIVFIEESNRMRWGKRLESAIANGIAEDQNWCVEPFKDYARIEEERIGSSFDYIIRDKYISQDEWKHTDPIGLLEIKNVDSLQFKNTWIIEEGEVIEAPYHIELQAQHQLMVTGYPIIWIGALVGGNSVMLIKRTPQENIIKAIKEKIKRFWDSIDANQPPKPDFTRDHLFLAELYSYSMPGKLLEAEDNSYLEKLAIKYNEAALEERGANVKKKAIKAEVLSIIGDVEKVKGSNFSINAGIVGPSKVEYERDGYRNFRVYLKKELTNG